MQKWWRGDEATYTQHHKTKTTLQYSSCTRHYMNKSSGNIFSIFSTAYSHTSSKLSSHYMSATLLMLVLFPLNFCLTAHVTILRRCDSIFGFASLERTYGKHLGLLKTRFRKTTGHGFYKKSKMKNKNFQFLKICFYVLKSKLNFVFLFNRHR